ncbi:MAG: potassium channel family protein [Euryarchaeota archaeon]|nr:potassium channel family protein [Euryarchaeota archaeon]
MLSDWTVSFGVMRTVYVAIGIVVLGITVVDLLWTTLWVEGGAGPLTAWLMAGTWAGMRTTVGHYPRVRSLSGPVILILTLSVWIVLLWAGWTLVFAGSASSLIDTVGRGPVSWIDRMYFVGYTLFTLGIGDIVPRDGRWQLATTMTTASGMLFVTLSVSYVLSVLDAVTQKRAFANGITGLGPQGSSIVRRGWTGEAFAGLELPLSASTAQLNRLVANHRAYPLLHYFHTTEAEHAPVVAIAILDDVLTLLRFGVADHDRPSEPITTNARASVDNYLELLRSAFIQPADRTPPPPDLDSLREAGIPTVSEEAFDGSLAEMADRRRALLGLVEDDLRQWPASEADRTEA